MDKRTCSVNGCDRPHYAKGICSVHYQRKLKHGTTDDPKQFPTVCSIEDCDGKVLAQGWCRKHYLRWYRYGDTGTPPRFQTRPCSVEGCETAAIKNGLCAKHHQRMKRRGTTDDPSPKPAMRKEPRNPRSPRLTECKEPDCTRPPRTRGWCKPHYKQLTGQGSAHEMKRYALKRGSQVEDVSYEEVIRRHGMICHLDGLPILTRKDCQIDHVIPLARGGPHTYENLRPAHAECNRRKNDKLMSEINGSITLSP